MFNYIGKRLVYIDGFTQYVAAYSIDITEVYIMDVMNPTHWNLTFHKSPAEKWSSLVHLTAGIVYHVGITSASEFTEFVDVNGWTLGNKQYFDGESVQEARVIVIQSVNISC